MEKIIGACIAISFCAFAFAQTRSQNCGFKITGNIIGQENGTISLTYIDSSGKRVKETCNLKNNKFLF
jgi:hypothetical protein